MSFRLLAAGVRKKCLNFNSMCPNSGQYVFACVQIGALWKQFFLFNKNDVKSEFYHEIRSESNGNASVIAPGQFKLV